MQFPRDPTTGAYFDRSADIRRIRRPITPVYTHRKKHTVGSLTRVRRVWSPSHYYYCHFRCVFLFKPYRVD